MPRAHLLGLIQLHFDSEMNVNLGTHANHVKAKQTELASKTASPAALAIGLPPYVLKCLAFSKLLAMAGVVTTAANGKPLPIPLAMVTISGTMSCDSKPQKWSPVRPKPV